MLVRIEACASNLHTGLLNPRQTSLGGIQAPSAFQAPVREMMKQLWAVTTG